MNRSIFKALKRTWNQKMFVLNNSLKLVKSLSSDMLRLLTSSHIWQRKLEERPSKSLSLRSGQIIDWLNIYWYLIYYISYIHKRFRHINKIKPSSSDTWAQHSAVINDSHTILWGSVFGQGFLWSSAVWGKWILTHNTINNFTWQYHWYMKRKKTDYTQWQSIFVDSK